MGARSSRPRGSTVLHAAARPPSPSQMQAAAASPHSEPVTLAARVPLMVFPPDGDALHEKTIKSVCVSGGYVYCGSWDHTATMWELESGEFVRSFRGHTQDIIGITTVSSLSGEWLFTCGDCVRMWEARTGEQVAALGSKDEHSLATFYAAIPDPVTNLLACAFCRGPIHVYDWRGPAELFAAQRAQTARPSVQYGIRPLLVLDGHTAGVMGLAVGELSGEQMLASASIDKTARLWSVRRGSCLRVLAGHEAPLRDVAISAGRVYTASLDLTAREWNPLTASCLRVFGPHLSPVRALLVVGHVLLTAEAPNSADPAGSRAVREFDVRTGEQLACHPHLHSAGIFHLFLHAPPAGGADAAQRCTVFTASQDRLVKRWRLVAPSDASAAAEPAERAQAAVGVAAPCGGAGAAERLPAAGVAAGWEEGEGSKGRAAADEGAAYVDPDDRARGRGAAPSGAGRLGLQLPGSRPSSAYSAAVSASAAATHPAPTGGAEGEPPSAGPSADAFEAQLPPELRRVVEATRAKIEELEEGARCFICLERPKNAAFVPCGHQACRRCAENFRQKKCAICRASVSGILALYG